VKDNKENSMFYCQITGRLSKPGEKQNKVTVETRERVYTKRIRNEETREWETVEIGRGFEIVRELNASDAGEQEWNAMSPEDRQAFLADLKAA
jgi:hypothetical protein